MLQRSLSCLLAVCLLMQGAWSFAATPAESVSQAQKRAKKSVSSSERLPVLNAAVVATLSGAAVMYGAMRWHIKRQKASWEKEITQKVHKQYQGRLHMYQDKVDGLLKQNSVLQGRLTEKNELLKTMSCLVDAESVRADKLGHLIADVYKYFQDPANIEKYAALYGKSRAELEVIVPEMLKKDMLQVSPRIQISQLEILEQDVIEVLSRSYPQSAVKFARYSSSTWHRGASFLFELAKNISVKNMVVVGVVALSGIAVMENADANNQIARLLENPSLLLSLNQEQAAQLNQHTSARVVCSMIADAYENAASLSDEELKELSVISRQQQKAHVNPAVLAR